MLRWLFRPRRDQHIKCCYAPAKGEILPLKTITTSIYHQLVTKNGFSLRPVEGQLYAPFSGMVTAVFPTQHAFILRVSPQLEVLVHIGIETVELKGHFFHLDVWPQKKLRGGQKIGYIELSHIREAGFNPLIMVVLFPAHHTQLLADIHLGPSLAGRGIGCFQVTPLIQTLPLA